MNLTQKQLATLAKVSTPTISRFENDEKDLQLSSVLAILDVLGMTDKRTLVFADQESQRDSTDAIVFWGQDGEARVRCRISRAAFKKYRKEIEALARRQYLYGQRELDGSVLIRTLDIA
jgi:transcriptional regulator with XRE-family HTH domain